MVRNIVGPISFKHLLISKGLFLMKWLNYYSDSLYFHIQLFFEENAKTIDFQSLCQCNTFVYGFSIRLIPIKVIPIFNFESLHTEMP